MRSVHDLLLNSPKFGRQRSPEIPYVSLFSLILFLLSAPFYALTFYYQCTFLAPFANDILTVLYKECHEKAGCPSLLNSAHLGSLCIPLRMSFPSTLVSGTVTMSFFELPLSSLLPSILLPLAEHLSSSTNIL